ncbi:MAG: hypothetical protein KH328_08980 [Staphylococcus sp.]|nr:hypothetical protein [Staphylococcus sp.]
MKLKAKKVLVGTVLTSLFCVPTLVAYAGADYITGGINARSSTCYYAWADYEHHMVNAKLDCQGYYTGSGWGYCETTELHIMSGASLTIKATWGYDGSYTNGGSATLRT